MKIIWRLNTLIVKKAWKFFFPGIAQPVRRCLVIVRIGLLRQVADSPHT